MEDDPTVRDRSNGTRNRDGTWAPGNRAAAGHGNARRMYELRKTLLATKLASEDAIAAAFSRLYWRAIGDPDDKNGASMDLDACRLYLSYVLGRPTVAVELSGPDGEALGIDLGKVKVAILAAVGDDQEMRHRIARALLSLDSGGDGDGPAGDGRD